MSVPTAETILATLKRVPLLSASQLRRVEEAAGRGAHAPDRVVGRLVEKGWVTRFQADTLLAGRAETLTVGPYLLLDLLGEGGMGRVYKARHVRLGRVDAVKVIRADKLASKTLARRFAREIRLTAILEHPNIVRALDAGESGGRLYLATEFIDGEDLATTVARSGPLSAADACLAAYQAALALQYVHDRGLVHRDVKPSNLMRERATRAIKLMDLGLSGVRAGDAGDAGASMAGGALTADGVMLGTPDFMPPEQARNPHGADIRADLYGLGCTLFSLLSGRPPFTGSTIEKLLAHASAPIPPVVTPSGPAPPALAAIVTRMMAKRPDDRFPTPAAVAEALLALRPGARLPEIQATSVAAPVAAADQSTAVPPEAWQTEFEELVDQAESLAEAQLVLTPPRRRPAWVLPAAAVVLAVVVAYLAFGRNRVQTPISEASSHQPQHTATPAEELRDLRAAAAGSEDRDAVRRRVIDFRAKHPGTPHAVAAAGIFRRLPSPLDRLPADAAPYVRAAGLGPPVGGLAFAADDTRLVIVRAGRPPEELALPELTPTASFPAAELARNAAALTPDGRVAAGADSAGRIVVWRAGGVRVLEVTGLKARAIGLASDGKTAVVVPDDEDEALARVDLAIGKVLGRLDVRAVGIRDVILAADGTACLLTADDGTVRVVPLPAGQPVRTIEPDPNAPGPPVAVCAPEGGRLYLAGIEATPGRYPPGADRSDLRYELPMVAARPFARSPRPTALAVSADEAEVAVGTATGRVVVFSAATGKFVAEHTLPGGVKTLAFSTHGRVLAAALDGGRVVLIPLGK